MREIRLYDTKTREVRPLEPREPGKVGIYACGPTVYARVHVGNARPFVVFSQLKRFLEHEGLEATLVANITDINDKIYDAARAAGPPVGGAGARDDRRTTSHDTGRLGLGRPDHEPLASESVGRDHRPDRGARGRRSRLRGGRRRLLPRALAATGYGELSRRDVDQMDQGEGVEGADRKEDPLDFALWKATKEGEDTSWDSPWGAGRPGLAHRVLRDGRAVPRAWTSTSTAAASTSSSRTTRTRRRRRWPGAASRSRACGCTTGCSSSPRRRCPSRSGNIRGLGDVLDEVGGEVLVLYFSGGHYRQPIAFSDERLADARARRGADPRGGAARWAPGDSPEELAPLRDAFFDALADDFNTARALAALYDWIREANRREGPVGGSHLREMLDVLGLGVAARRRGGRPAARGASSWPSARGAARDARDWAEADRLRDELRAMGWEVRDGPQGPELVPAG